MATSFLDNAEENAALINIISGKYAMASCSNRRAKTIKKLFFPKQPISNACRYYQKLIELIEIK